MNGSLISQLDLGISHAMIAVIAIGGCTLVAVISRLISHQQRMTRLIHRQHETEGLAARFDALESQIAELSKKVNQQALPPDDPRSSARE